ncbi:argininosuccinate lyase [Alicyclobacillus sp. SO9]|uniref:argininosuccinate lyase n=1 Tax=Alicyclobacillus sp. SO9 TaxID=2665646 RepID=UPI0018E7BAE1|nr:argininosuccinate lyase [Alicyclobacillus sp. SO9]QQE80672.1 argininosuccinate lyase [Alicyclobacillus sp. SO9]
MKLWGGRFSQDTNELVEQYTASIAFDKRLAEVDIRGSIAHAKMLGTTGIIAEVDANLLVTGLNEIRHDVEADKIEWRVEDEDIHMNVERLLHERIGPVAGKLHTGRSRNDQVALDMHLFVKESIQELQAAVSRLQQVLLEQSERHLDVVIPGYTHLQRAQPILFSHHLLAYFWMLQRDFDRLEDVHRRTDMSPLGAGALAGTTFAVDRQYTAKLLGFAGLYENSLDAVSDRDYLIEFLNTASILMMHLSRMSEELILWVSEEFGFIELSDAYCTGSSMMPQKKNPDVPEVIRGKTGRVYGHLMALLTTLKGLPLAYNKDMQEDKEGVFDTLDTLLPALELVRGMMNSFTVQTHRLKKVFGQDFSNATDVADYLVQKQMPFREAHAVVGQLVMQAIEKGTNLAGLSLADYKACSPLFDKDVFAAIEVRRVVDARQSRGGTGTSAVIQQIEYAKDTLRSQRSKSIGI